MKLSFAPVVAPNTRVLVLGSLPGEQSLAAQRYYANPRNQFWRMIGAVTGQELETLEYSARLQALLAVGIGLWDVFAAGERTGSLDAAIRSGRTNDLVGLASSLPRLRLIAFNGAKAASVGARVLGVRSAWPTIVLPSTSPARTTPFEHKRAAWLSLRPYLVDH